MVYGLFSGGAGFLALFIHDLLQLQSRPFLTSLSSFIGYAGVFLGVFIQIFLFHPPLRLSWVLALQLFALTASLGLLLYSVFFEIRRFEAKRGGRSVTVRGRTALTTGTYGVVRHPGFLWFVLLQFSIIWLCERREVLVMAAAFTLMDFVLVYAEDCCVFPKIFSNYRSYKARVPMIIPIPRGERDV